MPKKILKKAVFEILEHTRQTCLIEVPPDRICKLCGLKKNHYHFVANSSTTQVCASCRDDKALIVKFNKLDRLRTKRRTPEFRLWKNNQRKLQRKRDPLMKLANNIRTCLHKSLKKRGFVKKNTTESILGCSLQALKVHLESLFQPGMGWHNRGAWHIDHKTPLATAKSEAELIRLNHFSNLQPLWASDNLKKGAKILDEHGISY